MRTLVLVLALAVLAACGRPAGEAVECYAYAQGAIKLGVGQDVTTRVSERADKRYALQPYLAMSFGAVRVEGPAVVEISLKKA